MRSSRVNDRVGDDVVDLFYDLSYLLDRTQSKGFTTDIATAQIADMCRSVNGVPYQISGLTVAAR